MNPTTIRMILAAGIVWYALGGQIPGVSVPGVAPSGPYTGSMTALHTAAASMDPKDRAVLSEALAASGEMISADRAGLLTSTEALQKAARGSIAFGYSTFTVTKYPAVASLIQADLEKAIGSEVAAVTPEIRGKVAGVLSEAARALK